MFSCLIKEIILSAVMVSFLPLLASAKPEQRPMHSIVSHISILQELKERFAKKEPQPFFTKVVKTATESHFKIMKDNWIVTNAQKNHQALIDSVVAKEREYSETHYVFYHGQRAEHYILQDFLKQLYQFISIHAPLKDFEFLRPWHDAVQYVDANTYIDSYEKLNTFGWNDCTPKLKKEMMCVNLALMGNATYAGECTWHYFINNCNAGPVNIQFILEGIFSEFNLDKNYIPKLLDLFKKVPLKHGLLQQIFVPREKVDGCVYLSHDYGTPYRFPILADLFDLVKKRHRSISAVLDYYQNSPEKISKIDLLQARFLFSQDILLNPDSGVKVFRYSANDLGDTGNYQKDLQDLMQQIVTDWLSSGAFQKDLYKKNHYHAPFARLTRLMGL